MPSKLGPHSLVPNKSARLMVEAGCKVVKLVGDLGAAGEFLDLNSRLLVIGRVKSHYSNGTEITGENLREQGLSSWQAAKLWIESQADYIRLNPRIQYWEGVNEPQWKSQAEMRWYGYFEAERTKYLGLMNKRAVVGNFSVGVPFITQSDLSWWQAFLPALTTAKSFSGILGLHEYATAPFGDDWDGRYGWKTFRYRRVHDWFLAENGLGQLPVVLTEFGIDFEARNLNYLKELMWADYEMRRDDYLLGATIFTFGTNNRAWDDFNIDESSVAGPLIEYVRQIANQPDLQPLPLPIPLPTPSTKFAIGDRTRVTANIGLRVRSEPKYIASTIIGVKPLGSLGVVVGGPALDNEIVWWQVNNDTDPDGWMSEAYLEKYVAPPTPAPQPQTTKRLVFHEDFSRGQYLQFGPDQDNKRVPNEWTLWYADERTSRIDGQDESQYWIPPELEIKTRNQLHWSEIEKILDVNPDGFVYHIFRGWGRLWIKLWRKFKLEADRYQLEIQFWPDILLASKIENNRIVKTPDPNPLNNEFRFIVGRNEYPFMLGDQHPSGQYTTDRIDFNHTGGDIDLGGEFRARWGDLVVGWFIQSIKLWRIN